jgi:uncharacterized protein YecT (DUF1311 family)
VGIEDCQLKTEWRTDQRINRVAADIFRLLSHRTEPAFEAKTPRRDFVNGERAWLRYRTTYCISVSDQYLGGSAQPILLNECTVEISQQHLKDLRVFKATLSDR